MYLVGQKGNKTIYGTYKPKYSNHKNIEVESYVAKVVGDDISKRMNTTVQRMSTMIVHGFSKGGK